MTRWVEVSLAGGSAPLLRARWCASFPCRLAGLMFRRRLSPGEGLLLVQPQASRLNSAIHMGFVFMTLGVVWLDDDGTIVACVRALPWRIYWPPRRASYILEAEPHLIESLAPGMRLAFRDS